jgi:ArsR family transcriptional regulator
VIVPRYRLKERAREPEACLTSIGVLAPSSAAKIISEYPNVRIWIERLRRLKSSVSFARFPLRYEKLWCESPINSRAVDSSSCRYTVCLPSEEQARSARRLSGAWADNNTTSEFASMSEAASRTFRALSDPTRLRIRHLLMTGEPCVADLVKVLKVPQPTASRHLNYLKTAGLVTSRKGGYWTYYSLVLPRTVLGRKVIEVLQADTAGQNRDHERLTTILRDGGCCPR